MKMTPAEKKAKRLQRQAQTILRQTRLLNLLRRYGQVHPTGSYVLNLMTVRDIDIYVVSQRFNEKIVMEVLQKLITGHQFRGYMYNDFTLHRRKGFPRGWYIGLKKRIRGEKWKIDVWLLRKNSRPRVEDLHISPAQRRTILRLKTLRDNKGIRGLDLPGWNIYQAVLKKDSLSIRMLKKVGIK